MLTNRFLIGRFLKHIFIITIIFALILFMFYNLFLSFFFRKIFLSSDDKYTNPYFDKNLKIHLVDVGQGDGMVITADDKVIVIDAGPILHFKALTNYLNSIGVKRINTLILTHPHQDHFGGLESLLCNFKVDKIYLPDIEPTIKMSFAEKFHFYKYNFIISKYTSINKDVKINSIKDKNGNLTDFTDGEIYIKFLSPTRVYENLNNNSIVCRVEYNDISVLLTGDIEAKAEKDLLKFYGKTGELNVDILKIAHHGSRTSSTEDFINVVKPQIALISCAKDTKLWHPHKSTTSILKRKNITLYRTDEQGTVVISTDGDYFESNCSHADYKCGTELSQNLKKSKK